MRGPRTARALGLPVDAAIADAAYLLGSLNWSAWRNYSATDAVVVPHHRSLRLLDWDALCARAGVRFLSPLEPADRFLRELCSARVVITEAMHGAILADIVRTPWVAFQFGRQFSEDKWYDWSEAFGMTLRFESIEGFYDPTWHSPHRGYFHHAGNGFKSWLWQRGLGKAKWGGLTPPARHLSRSLGRVEQALIRLAQAPGQLSDAAMFDQRVEQLYARLDTLRQGMGLAVGKRLTGPPEGLFARQAPIHDGVVW